MEQTRLGLYRSLAPVKLVRVGGAEILAAAHPGLAPGGTLSQPIGDPAAFSAAITAGEAWLLGRGCSRALGPMEVCTWFPYRASLGPHDYPTFLGEPVASVEPWLEAGYTPEAPYESVLVSHRVTLERYPGAEARAASAGFTLRDLRPEVLADELRIFWKLSHAVFAEAYGFVPLPWPAFRTIYEPYHRLMDPRQVCIAEGPGGEPVGFFLTYPGPEAKDGRAAIYKTLAVHPDARGRGLAQALVVRAHRVAAELGMSGGMIHALMWAEALSSFMAASGGQVVRRYTLLARSLATGSNRA